MENWLEIAGRTHRRHLASGSLQDFENPACGQNEKPRRRYWVWEAISSRIICEVLIEFKTHF